MKSSGSRSRSSSKPIGPITRSSGSSRAQSGGGPGSYGSAPSVAASAAPSAAESSEASVAPSVVGASSPQATSSEATTKKSPRVNITRRYSTHPRDRDSKTQQRWTI